MVLERFELFCSNWNAGMYRWCKINDITIYKVDNLSFKISNWGVTDYLDLVTKIGVVIFSVAIEDITSFSATLKEKGEEDA